MAEVFAAPDLCFLIADHLEERDAVMMLTSSKQLMIDVGGKWLEKQVQFYRFCLLILLKEDYRFCLPSWYPSEADLGTRLQIWTQWKEEQHNMNCLEEDIEKKLRMLIRSICCIALGSPVGPSRPRPSPLKRPASNTSSNERASKKGRRPRIFYPNIFTTFFYLLFSLSSSFFLRVCLIV